MCGRRVYLLLAACSCTHCWNYAQWWAMQKEMWHCWNAGESLLSCNQAASNIWLKSHGDFSSFPEIAAANSSHAVWPAARGETGQLAVGKIWRQLIAGGITRLKVACSELIVDSLQVLVCLSSFGNFVHPQEELPTWATQVSTLG